MLNAIDILRSFCLLWDLGYDGNPLDKREVSEFLCNLCQQRIVQTRWYDYRILQLRFCDWQHGYMTWNNLAFDLNDLVKTDKAYLDGIEQ